jgi:hypothetical protein
MALQWGPGTPDAASGAHPPPGEVPARVLLACGRCRVNGGSQLHAECNGLVFDMRTRRPLVIPPRGFSDRPPAAQVLDPLLGADAFDIIQVCDGTVATIYRWEHPAHGPIWCLATQRGYDVSALRWVGALTWAEVLHELLAAYPVCVEAAGLTLRRGVLGPEDVRLDFAALDPRHCYTVGFRHKDPHPLQADPPGVWNIQSADLSTGVAAYGPEAPGLPHLPRQATYSLQDLCRQLGAESGRAPATAAPGPPTRAMLERVGQSALEKAKAAISRGGPYWSPLPPAPGRHRCPFHYGFLLRARDPSVTRGVPDLLLESPLLRRVRQLVYASPPGSGHEWLDHSSRLEYHALRAYLSVGDREDFLALFPEFAPRFDRYRSFVENLIHEVLHLSRQNAMGPLGCTAGLPRTRTATVARGLLAFIVQHEKDFQPFHEQAASIVRDFAMRQEYAPLYLKAMQRI